MTKHRLSFAFIAAALLAAFAASAQARSNISCESREYRYNRCETYTDGYARLLSQQSQAPCIRGQTWGYDDRGIWVDKGCAGEFEVGGGARRLDIKKRERNIAKGLEQGKRHPCR